MAGGFEDLQGKVVLVTGGSSGLGLAVAEAFAGHGARVVIVGRDAAKLQEAQRRFAAGVHAESFDLRATGRLPELLDRIRTSVGPVDVLVNSAGVHMKKDALEVTDQEYQSVILTNQTAVFALTREVGRTMVERRSGSIIMISSMASQYGIPKVVGYSASKAAIEGMTRALAVEWSPFGVRVNCIAPGFIATAMSAGALDNDPERKSRVLLRTPLGRLGDPADVAHACLFLASSLSSYITGVVLPVDGGNAIGF